MNNEQKLFARLRAKLDEIKKDRGYHGQHREELKQLLAQCVKEVQKGKR